MDVNHITAESWDFSLMVIVLFQVHCVEAQTQNNKKYYWEAALSLLFSSVHSPIEEKENNSDGASLYVSVSDSRPAQRDGRFHADTGGRPATEIDGSWEGNAEQSNESAGCHAWKDQPRKPWETPCTCGQDTL